MALQKIVPSAILERFDQLKWSGNGTTPYHHEDHNAHCDEGCSDQR
jgi:hypothetical protein